MHGHHRAINIILSSNVQKYQKKHNLSLIPIEPENWSIIVISKRVFNSRILWELHGMFISFKESDCKKKRGLELPKENVPTFKIETLEKESNQEYLVLR